MSVVLSLVAYGGLHFVRLPGEYNEPFLLGYREYARTDIDVPAIRAWLDTQDPNAYRGARIDLYALTDEQKASLPQAITSLKPYWVEFFRDAHNHWAIRLDWGHVNDDWGVEIGRPDMEIPQTTLAKEEERYREFSIPTRRLPLPPGAYVWLCGNRHVKGPHVGAELGPTYGILYTLTSRR
ncbi:MAG: hypothetical protein JW955_08565, partial [Sedimentisphaerales bacterium]|nr:hypothetical protein [Sedimentisphaerales bacterium]